MKPQELLNQLAAAKIEMDALVSLDGGIVTKQAEIELARRSDHRPRRFAAFVLPAREGEVTAKVRRSSGFGTPLPKFVV